MLSICCIKNDQAHVAQSDARAASLGAGRSIQLRRLSLAESSLPLRVTQVPLRAEPKEAIMTSYAFLPALKALSLRFVNSAYNVSLAASIAFVFLVFITSILAMAVWGRVIELPDFHRSI